MNADLYRNPERSRGDAIADAVRDRQFLLGHCSASQRLAAHRHGRATWNGVRSHSDALTKSGGPAAHRHGRATWNGVRSHSDALTKSRLLAAHRHGRATWNGVRSHSDALTKSRLLPRIGMAEPSRRSHSGSSKLRLASARYRS